MELWLQIIGTVGTIVVAIIGGIFTVRQAKVSADMSSEREANKQERERIDKRAEQRVRESLLTMRLINADTQLTLGVAMALKHGHANGEIEEGLAAVKTAQEEYQKFNEELAASCKT